MWKQIVKFCLLGLIVVSVQNAILWPWLGDDYVIDLVLIASAVLAVSKPYHSALGYGLGLALMMDLVNPVLFGVYLASTWVIITVSELLQTTWLKQPSLLQGATITGLAMLAGLTIYLAILQIGWYAKLSLVNPASLITLTGLLLSWVTLTITSALFIYFWRRYDRRSI